MAALSDLIARARSGALRSSELTDATATMTSLGDQGVETVYGVAVRTAAPGDIVVMKILAGRPKDIEDVTAILRRAPEGLDEGEVRGTLRELETMLDQTDLLPLFDGAPRRARPR